MQSHSHTDFRAHRPVLFKQGSLCGNSGGNRATRMGKNREVGIPVHIHFAASILEYRRSQQNQMALQGFFELVSQQLQKLGRAFDVGEKYGYPFIRMIKSLGCLRLAPVILGHFRWAAFIRIGFMSRQHPAAVPRNDTLRTLAED
jgi:hypothetical protein